MSTHREDEINRLCRMHGVSESLRSGLIACGASISDAQVAILDTLVFRETGRGPSIDFPRREIAKYSLVRAINASLDRDWSQAGFEREVSKELATRLGREPAHAGAFWFPTNMPMRPPNYRAPYAVGATGTGGALVETELLASSFIEVLRNRIKVIQAGATMLTGLVGLVNIPRQITQTQTYWVGESVAITEAEATVNVQALSPKTVGAYSIMSRLTLLQTTPDIEVVVRNDFANVLAIAIDLAALSGSGASGQPTGIRNMAGIGSVVGGTNGAQILIDHLIQLEAQLTVANVPMESLGYLTNLKVVGALKNIKATTGQYLWNDIVNGSFGQREGTPSTINEWPLYRSNQASYTLTKGTSSGICSELFFANWAELFIGEWGALEVLANPYDATGFPKGDVTIRALQTVDVEPRHTASFAYMGDALTTPF